MLPSVRAGTTLLALAAVSLIVFQRLSDDGVRLRHTTVAQKSQEIVETSEPPSSLPSVGPFLLESCSPSSAPSSSGSASSAPESPSVSSTSLPSSTASPSATSSASAPPSPSSDSAGADGADSGERQPFGELGGAPPPLPFPEACYTGGAFLPREELACYRALEAETKRELAEDPRRPYCWGFDDPAAGFDAQAPPHGLLYHTIALTAMPAAITLPLYSFLATQCCDAVLWFWTGPGVTLPPDPAAHYGIPAHQARRVVWKRLDLDAMFAGVAGDFPAANRSALAALQGFHDIRYVADWARMLVMYVHGGTYYDIDTVVLRDLRPVARLHPTALLAYREPPGPFMNNALLRVPQRPSGLGHEILRHTLDRADPKPHTMCQGIVDVNQPGARGWDRLVNRSTMVRMSTSTADFLWFKFLSKVNNPGFFDPDMLGVHPELSRERHWNDFFVELADPALLARAQDGSETFMAGSYVYHWHNRYDQGLGHSASWAAILNTRFRRLMEDKRCGAGKAPTASRGSASVSPPAPASSASAASSASTGLNGCFQAASGPISSLAHTKAAVFTCTAVRFILDTIPVTGAQGAPAITLDSILAPWVDAEFAVVLVNDCADSEDGAGFSAWALASPAVSRVISAAEVACAAAPSPAGAGVLWAVASGMAEVADVTHPWQLSLRTVMTFPAGNATLLPARTAESLAARPVSLGDHFTPHGLLRIRQAVATAAGVSTDGRGPHDTCTRPVYPTVQVGLCHPQAGYVPGGHTTVAANAAADEGQGSPALSALLEHVTPLVLPLGLPLAAAAAAAPPLAHPPTHVRLVHRSAAWALYGTEGSAALAAVQGLLALTGHALTVLPPGRTCNVSLPAAAAPAVPTTAVDGLAQLLLAQQLAREALPSPLLGRPGVAAALSHLPAVAAVVGLSESDAASLRRWLELVEAAYAAAGLPLGDGAPSTPSTLPSLASYIHAPHCWADHPNVRDVVLMVNFNSWGNWSDTTLPVLRRAYGDFYPLIVAFGGDFTMQRDVPSLNAWRCASDWGRTMGWMGGLIGEACGAQLVRRFPGHLGYAIVQDDVLWFSWNHLAMDPHAVWAISHAPSNDPGGVGDRSTWFYGCNRGEHKLANGSPHYCYGCYHWYGPIGGMTVASIHGRFTPAQLAVKAANTGYPDGVSCDLTDAFYIPGVRSREFRDLCDLFAGANTEVELAFSTIIDTLELRANQQVLRHVNAWNRKTLADLMGYYESKEVAARPDALTTLDWFHPFKLSAPDVRTFFEGEFARAHAANLFTTPNVTALRARPVVSYGHL